MEEQGKLNLDLLHFGEAKPPKDVEIERIAWEVFLEKISLSFVRELTAEEKKSITDQESYQYYRDEAIKIYDKREKAVLNCNKYTIIDVPASGNKKWLGGAFSMLFVYSKHDGNFILRGYSAECNEYLKNNYTHYFYNHTMFHKYQSRSFWGFWKKGVGIFEPDKRKNKYSVKNDFKWTVREYSNSFTANENEEKFKKERALHFKRLPKRWIPEFDRF